ncbi:MAG: hypothetical protein HZA03_08530 [Nitrospinae bacterium]|nr:hypothetical protein [Nitrospinota bacterium]
MPAADAPPFFTPGLEDRIESHAVAARGNGRRVNAFTAAWHLFLAPLFLFVFHLLLRGRFFSGYAGFRESVHTAAFLFAVNARVYELTHADPAELGRIRKEFD